MERLITHWIGSLRQYETIYLQIDLGLLDEAAVNRPGWGNSAMWPRYVTCGLMWACIWTLTSRITSLRIGRRFLRRQMVFPLSHGD